MEVLVIGGSGFVGRLILPMLRERHCVTVFDRDAPRETAAGFLRGDVTDSRSLAGAMRGRQAVVYLAMGKDEKGNVDAPGAAYDVNVKGVHLACQAALEAGAKRFVYMSTLSVYSGGNRFFASEDEPPDPPGAYGFTKALGEEVCRFFSRVHGLDCIALRLNAPVELKDWKDCYMRHPGCGATSGPDIARAVLAALECRHSGFDAVFISGDFEGKLTNLSKAKRLLGWEPLERP